MLILVPLNILNKHSTSTLTFVTYIKLVPQLRTSLKNRSWNFKTKAFLIYVLNIFLFQNKNLYNVKSSLYTLQFLKHSDVVFQNKSICNIQTKRGKGEIHMLIVKKSSIVNN